MKQELKDLGFIQIGSNIDSQWWEFHLKNGNVLTVCDQTGHTYLEDGKNGTSDVVNEIATIDQVKETLNTFQLCQ